MLLAVLLGFLGAILAPFAHRLLGDWTGRLMALLPLGMFVYFLALAPQVVAEGTLLQRIPWVPSFGVDLTFALDGLSLTFSLLITGLGALIVLYAGDYLHGDPMRGRFLAYLVGFLASMLGVVLADNLIALFVFWELTSFTSYLLIGYQHDKEESRASALQALIVTAGGGLVLLAGVFLLAFAGDSYSIQELIAGGGIQESPLYVGALLCVVVGAFTKSAQVPFHFWLPNAMAAPTPVSAFLHSATMVKAGVYLLARLDAVLGGTELWTLILVTAGTATMLTGAIMALRQTDLKKILAYSTITALGTLVALIGASVPLAVEAAVTFLIVHSLYKGALFLIAGSIDHETGTRNVLLLGGLRGKMPITFGAALLAGLSMAGLPPLFGFIGKELIYEANLASGEFAVIVIVTAVLANALTVVAAGLVVLRPFFGQLETTPRVPHEAPIAMWLGPALLGLTGLLFGLLPGLAASPLVGAAATGILAQDTVVDLYIWHGFNLPLLLSVVTMALGIAGYLLWPKILAGLTRLDAVMARGPEAGYNWFMDALPKVAKAQTRFIQHGNLGGYLAVIFLFVIVFNAGAFLRGAWPGLALPAIEATFYEITVMLVIIGGSAGALFTHSRLTAVAMLGSAGFAVSLLFLFMGAPDLAMTQLLVETLTVIVIVLVMRRLPSIRDMRPPSPATRTRDILIALSMGATVSVLLLAVLQLPVDRTVADQLAALSYPEGFGRNIVNVILVDFRALDTLGEIVVLATAALGAITLMRRREATPGEADLTHTADDGGARHHSEAERGGHPDEVA
ncbi:putative monovalent cation/H+ antiporter subunit A [soil metagenome]